MKMLFWGSINGNTGPININKGIVSSLTDRVLYSYAPGNLRRTADAFWKLLRAEAVLVSGLSRQGVFLVRVARILKKPSIYLMHGCAEQEYKLNNQTANKKVLAQETYLLENADLILAVSKRYMHWVREQYPRYAGKIDYIYNGVDRKIFVRRKPENQLSGTVAVVGGSALLKNNLIVARAVESLEGTAGLSVYGYSDKNHAEDYRYTEYAGKLDHAEFLERLSETKLFVLNSLLESFSSAVLEALACGCSLLVSERAGVCDLLALEETDIIHDPMDVDEIAGKIAYLLEHPNHQRLYDAFDPDEWSFEKMVLRLEDKCRELVRKNRNGRK